MHVLSTHGADVLTRLAWADVLLAFDFDGTLAPIVEARDDARMRARTRSLLGRVSARYPCAVISGRGRDDVARRLEGITVPYVIGNHGLEPGQRLEAFAREVDLIRPLLEASLQDQGGVDIEDKRYSLAIHYRRARAKREARARIRAAIESLPVEVRVIAGKLVINVLPKGAPNKGDALLAVRAQARADVALYVGDDVTDEDVFELDQPGRLVSVRVGRSRTSAASYFLRDQREMDALLERLVALRSTPTTPAVKGPEP